MKLSAVNKKIPSWRTDKRSAAARGYGRAWQKARADFLRKHPLCVMCKTKGKIRAANVVDHIQPHRGDKGLFWDRDNWQALCKPCHDGDKRRIENGNEPRNFAKFDANGRVIWD